MSDDERTAGDDLQRLVERMREKAPPAEPEPAYVCAACKDTGLVYTDEGVDDDGRRVKARTGYPCSSLVHAPPPVEVLNTTPDRFS